MILGLWRRACAEAAREIVQTDCLVDDTVPRGRRGHSGRISVESLMRNLESRNQNQVDQISENP